MIRFYFNPSPNPAKVALFLEESGLAYEAVPLDARRGEQFSADFLAINPNAKAPAITDGDVTVFDSNAILLYLAEQHQQFLPRRVPVVRGEMLSWLMFVASGIGPYCGQAVHFKHYAPEPKDYPLSRYLFEAQRHWTIVDRRLGEHPFMVDDSYSIVDMAVWGWTRAIPFIFGDDAWLRFRHVKRLVDEIAARPAAARVTTLFAAHTFKTEMDDDARRNMFPHVAAPPAG
jgi:GST-like protein